MSVGIYPPVLQSTQTAFIYSVTNYQIYFDLHKMTSFSDIEQGHIAIRIMKQSNNRSIVDTNRYPDGNIYLNGVNIQYDRDVSHYYVNIPSSYLQEAWQPGYLYKVQMRFGSSLIWTSTGERFVDWKNRLINMSNGFSEWSTVMVLKAISQPTIYIANKQQTKYDITQSYQTESTTTPLFTGIFSIPAGNKEAENIFKFSLYDGENTESLIETSGWIQHNQYVDSTDEFRFKTYLIKSHTYTVKYEIKTVNGYEATAELYTFMVNESYLNKINNTQLIVDDSAIYCSENGCMNIYLTTINDASLTGNFIISRSCETSDFAVYEDIKYLLFKDQEFDHTLIFQDFTIESGIKYKYAIAQINSSDIRSEPLYENEKPYRVVDFEYAFLYRDGIQLRLKFNNTMNSFKHTVLQSKQDTLGNKYPYVSRNGYAYYAEFPINGLISLHMDSDQTFFQEHIYEYESEYEDGLYYKDELIIPKDKYRQGTDDIKTFDVNLTHNNIFVERKFREKVEEFLTDFDYKLYKSPTEGNIIVVLQNVSLTPKQELGRMIFQFSATAYEVAENTLENLNEYKIIDISTSQELSDDDTTEVFGQLSGFMNGDYLPSTLVGSISTYSTRTNPDDFTTLIAAQEEKHLEGGFKTSVKRIKAFSVEQYPSKDFTADILALEAQRATLANEGEPTDEIDEQIAELEQLIEVVKYTPEITNIVIVLNGKDIIMKTGKMYYLNNMDGDKPTIHLKYSGPIIFNYICELVQVPDDEAGVVERIETARIWGQIAGMFTDTHSILRNYDHLYKDSETYRIYNPRGDSSVIKDAYGNIIVDNTNINLYKTRNLMDVIKQETKKQIELLYDISPFSNYDEHTGLWDNGQIYYSFDDVYLFDIEADPGTILYIGAHADGSDKAEIIIGPTGRYTLNPSDELIKYIQFKEPQFAIINYKCYTSQQIMKGA